MIERGYQISSNDCQDCRAIKNKVDRPVVDGGDR